MAKINLRDYYPFYQYDCIIDVPDEVTDALLKLERLEAAYQRRMYRHKAYYTLDQDDGIEHDILLLRWLQPKSTNARLHMSNSMPL